MMWRGISLGLATRVDREPCILRYINVSAAISVLKISYPKIQVMERSIAQVFRKVGTTQATAPVRMDV